MRLGVLGGSFDPVHYGHLLLAECCREQHGLDRVWFVPAAQPPHKQGRHLADATARLDMLHLAVSGHEAFGVSPCEIQRGGVSYTVDTLRHFRGEFPDAELFFLMGADMLPDLPIWQEAAAVCELATLVVVRRPGVPEPDFACLKSVASAQRIEWFRQHQVTMPEIGLCSSDIRHRVAANQSIRYRTPAAVEQYIRAHGLYRAP